MNGAGALIETLVASGVEVCFANPGTSEMHFVAALDETPAMRGILGLFEGGVTGMADGYARVAGKPAATLLHLGPGLGNGLANLHNARRAATPVVNIVGDHARYHKRFDAPLESDIEGIARAVSKWYRVTMTPECVSGDTVDAVAAASTDPAGVATLVLPADVSWSPVEGPLASPMPTFAAAQSPRVAEAVHAIKSARNPALLLGGHALRERGLRAASRLGGLKLLAETFPANLERGAGLPAVERLGYLSEFVEAQLAGVDLLVLAGARAPVSFFAYPTKPSWLVPDGCALLDLGGPGVDVPLALEDLADEIGGEPVLEPARRPERPTGPITGETIGAAIGALLPEGAIVVDESNTSGLFIPGATAGAPRHDWITLTGGAIGQGIPAATGAAVAAPDRRVISLEADGSAMYTFQALWTQARLGLDVTTLVFSNRSYAILQLELGRVGAVGGHGDQSRAMLEIPGLDFVALAQGMGVPGVRVSTADDLVTELERSLGLSGPRLIELDQQGSMI